MAEDLAEELGRNIPLSEMIQSLRTELAVAMKQGDGKALRFTLESVDLELHVAVARSKGVKGGVKAGVKFFVINAGGKLGQTQQSHHVFKLKLTPHEPDGGPIELADES